MFSAKTALSLTGILLWAREKLKKEARRIAMGYIAGLGTQKANKVTITGLRIR